MSEWSAPAKVNLDLRVGSPRADGLHPLRSVVQTIEWCDDLDVEEGDEDELVVEGAEVPEGGENLVWRALEALGAARPPLRFSLHKRIPVAAGLGGGSSDAAATLMAVTDMLGIPAEVRDEVAPRVGADVAFLLQGGTALMEGTGERITALDALGECAVAVVVPPFELPTPDVYRRWDALDRPVGETVDRFRLPPPLRALDDVRNDLTPAALSLRPELGDWIDELAGEWGRPVFMSGSGPSMFGVFVDEDEAAGALAVAGEHRGAIAAALRPTGVGRREA
jgi:4-diphosphocytidyl-2-C-methyl-D-erythritol kinase